MKRIFPVSILIFVALLHLTCKRGKAPFTPPDKRQVQSIQVGDADEAALLQQELKIEIQQVKDKRLFYFAGSKDIDARLSELGYSIRKEDLMQVYDKYVQVTVNGKVPDSSKSVELEKLGVTLINREEKYWIIRGTLEQLSEVKKKGYQLKELDHEPRPRGVEITVNNQAEVQKVNETGVDIYHTENKDNKIIVHGAAFDNQIELMRKMGYTVVVVRK